MTFLLWLDVRMLELVTINVPCIKKKGKNTINQNNQNKRVNMNMQCRVSLPTFRRNMWHPSSR
jgi:hypothetical protein